MSAVSASLESSVRRVGVTAVQRAIVGDRGQERVPNCVFAAATLTREGALMGACRQSLAMKT